MRNTLIVAFVALVAFVVAMAAWPAATAAPVYERVHAATLRLEVPDGICSGTAVGKRWILSASHCFTGTAPKTILANGETCEVRAIEHDGQDHALVRLGGCEFSVSAEVGKAPGVGDAIFYYGNPGPFRDMLRFGRVAGYQDNAMPGMGRAQFLDIPGTFGDSGAGVFNEAGQLVGVISIGNRAASFMGVFPLAFSAQQWEAASK